LGDAVRIFLPSGTVANVAKDVSPETLEALDEMMKLVVKQFECGGAAQEARLSATGQSGFERKKFRCGKRCRLKGTPHNHCKGCGYAVSDWDDWCGECLCEDDGL